MRRAPRLAIVLAVAGVAAVAVWLHPPIPQDPAYHRFADRRPLLGLPHALNVLSNAPFAVVGVLGLAALLGGRPPVRFLDPRERWWYVVFFVGVGFTGLGSAYYHLAPDNERLVWDRLPMTLAFMGLLAAIVGERVDVRAGLRLLPPLLALGVASVVQWHATERAGVGDLRLYVLVQFVPLLVVPLLMGLYGPRYSRGTDVLGVVALYATAKLLELGDAAVFGLGHVVSGHTLKHLTAAAGTSWILRMLTKRAPVAMVAPVDFDVGREAMSRRFLVLVALVLTAGCASSSESRAPSSGAGGRPEQRLQKVWLAEGVDFRGYDTLYVAETRADVANLNPDGKENLEWARGVVRDEVAEAIRAKNLFPAVVTREADIKPNSKALKLEHTIVEYEKGGGGARFFAGITGAGQPLITVAGRISDGSREVFRFEARRRGEGSRARWLGGYLSDKDIQTGDIRDLSQAVAEFMAGTGRR